ncbi:hypothetical protein MMPV_001841 [Pyropia vietnamensis]
MDDWLSSVLPRPPSPPSSPPLPPLLLPVLTLPDLPHEVLTLIVAAVLQSAVRPLVPLASALPEDDDDGTGGGGRAEAPPPGWSTLGAPLVTAGAWAAAAPFAATCRACRSAFFAAITGLPPPRRFLAAADAAAVGVLAADSAARREAALAVLAGGLWPALGRCTALRVLVLRLPAAVGPARRSLPQSTADAVDKGLAGALVTAAAAATVAAGGRGGESGLTAFVQVSGPPLPRATAAAMAAAASAGRRLRVLVVSVAPAGVDVGRGWGDNPRPPWAGSGSTAWNTATTVGGVATYPPGWDGGGPSGYFPDSDGGALSDFAAGQHFSPPAAACPPGWGGGGPSPFSTPSHHPIPPTAAEALVHLGWTPPPEGWAVAYRGAPPPAAGALAAVCAPHAGPSRWRYPLALGGLRSVELPPGVDMQTVDALVRVCPRLRRVVLVRPWDGSWRVLVPLCRLPDLDCLDLGGWDGTGEAVTALLPVLAAGGGGMPLDGVPPRRIYRRLVLPPREPDHATATALAGALPQLPPTLSWTLLSRGPRGGDAAVAGLAAHPGAAALRSLHLVNISSAGVGALVGAAAGAAVAARLTRLVLDSGVPAGRLGVAGIDVAALGGVLLRVRVLELRAYRLDGGGVPLLLWAIGRAQAWRRAIADVCGSSGCGDSGRLLLPLSLPPLTSVSLDSCMGVWALAGAATLGDPDVFPIGYDCPLPQLRRVALFGCTTARALAEGGPPEVGSGPRRRVRAAYPAVEWVEERAPVDPPPPLFEW